MQYNLTIINNATIENIFQKAQKSKKSNKKIKCLIHSKAAYELTSTRIINKEKSRSISGSCLKSQL